MKKFIFVIFPEGYVIGCEGDDVQDQLEILTLLLPESEDPEARTEQIFKLYRDRHVIVW